MASIFLLEDDKVLSRGIEISLSKDNHKITTAYSFFEGAQKYINDDFDLFLLDINLPDGSGLDFCEKIRETKSAPILFLTANDTEQDMLKGFSAGCDDYISKPFSVEVLRKKVLAVLRLSDKSIKSDEGSVFSYCDLTINFDKRSVKLCGKDINLTVTEFKILQHLIKNSGQVITRNSLLSAIWDVDENYIDKNTLSVHIKRLRQKLNDDPRFPKYIVTVFGIGYTFGE